MKTELDYEKSLLLAKHIELLKVAISYIDLDYAKELIISLKKQAAFHHSASVVNPLHNPFKDELIMTQAEVLSLIVNIVDKLKECSALKDNIAVFENKRNEMINSLFI